MDLVDESYCSVCVEIDEVREFRQEPIWKGRDGAIIVLSAILLLIGFVVSREDLALFFFLAAAVLSGHGIIKHGLSSLLKGKFTIDLLISIAASGAFLIGQSGEGAAVMVLFFIAEFLEEHATDRAKSSLGELFKLAPEVATVRRNKEEKKVHVHDISVGEIVIVRPGEKIPLDGTVVKGESNVDQSAITGESLPVFKNINSKTFSGSFNHDGYLEIRVEQDSEHSMISRIIKLVSDAQKQKSESEKFIDRFSGYYTPGVIFLAVAVAVIPHFLFGLDLETWVYRALVLLVVSCPCALAISTPVSMVSAITSAARNGVLIRGGRYLEALSQVNAVAFDKTGTLTEGRLEVSDILSTNNQSQQDILRIAASLENNSEHPIARTIVERAKKDGLKLLQPSEFKSSPGKGIEGRLKGEKYFIGNRKILDDLEIRLQDGEVKRLEDEGKTVVFLAKNRELIGLIAVSDRLREGAADVVRDLKERGVRVEMLTGDNERVAKAIASKLGIHEYHADLLPEDKVRIVEEELMLYGSVAMIGDGVNDAPALARADVGISMGSGGSDIAIENSDIALMENNVKKVVYLFNLSKKTSRIVRENMFASILVKGSFALIAVPGFLPLWVAVAVGDMGLSLAVIMNAMRLSGEGSGK